MSAAHQYALMQNMFSLIGNMLFCIIVITIGWLIYRTRLNADNKNAEIIMKAIETNSNVDADKLISALSRPRKSRERISQGYLLRGCIGTILGIAAIIINAVLRTIPDINPEGLFLIMSFAGICMAIGLAYLIVYFVSRKSANKNKE
ncbi:MAG: hypothetical protein K2J09_02645 [Muribaculaceae bacterium]|nr:hypothetical protein [Muribaculaceae bacterium]